MTGNVNGMGRGGGGERVGVKMAITARKIQL